MDEIKGIRIVSLAGEKEYGIEDSEVRQDVQQIVEGAPEAFDTFKEIAEYIAEDGATAAEIIKNVAANAQGIANEITRAKAAEQALEERIDNIPLATTESDGLMSAEDKERVDGNINSSSYIITDGSGNIILKIDENGIKTTDVTISQGKLSNILNIITDAIETVKVDTKAEVKTLNETIKQNTNKLNGKIDSEIENDSFFITDASGNIIFKVDAAGVHSINVGNSTPTWIIIQVLSEAYIPSNIERDSVGDVVSCNALFIDGVEGSIAFTRDDGEVAHIVATHGNVSVEAKIIRNNGNVEQINIL